MIEIFNKNNKIVIAFFKIIYKFKKKNNNSNRKSKII